LNPFIKEAILLKEYASNSRDDEWMTEIMMLGWLSGECPKFQMPMQMKKRPI